MINANNDILVVGKSTENDYMGAVRVDGRTILKADCKDTGGRVVRRGLFDQLIDRQLLKINFAT
jgi:hypothetical protein